MMSRPPLGMASRELTARLMRICSIMLRSAWIGGAARGKLGFQADVFANEPLQHFGGVGDNFIEVDRFGLEQLPPAEGEQLAGEIGGAFGGLGDFDQARQPGRGFGFPAAASRAIWPRMTVRRLLKS